MNAVRRLLFSPKGGLGPLYSNAFDSGSINTFTLVDGTPTYRIAPISHWNSQWLWFAIRSKKWAGTNPHFLVAKANRYTAPAVNENLAVWGTSLDSDTWTKFANQSVGASDIEFYHDSAFPGGMIYVAYLPLYPFSRIARKVAEWAAADGRILDTRSSDNLVISYSTARTNRDGRTAPVLPFYAFSLTNDNANAKNNMIISGGNHPSETTGNYQLEGAIDWLLAGSPEAEFLLDWFNVLVYPCTNPQGRWGGWFRSCPQVPTEDHNRMWDVDTLECIAAFRAAIAVDCQGAVEVGIDFHSATSASAPYMDSIDHTETVYAAYLAKVRTLDPTFSYNDGGVVTEKLSYLLRNTYSAKLALTDEAMCLTSLDVPNFKTEGQNGVKAIALMHAEGYWTHGPDVGSRDFNGTTDRIDWTAPLELTGSPLSISLCIIFDSVLANRYLFHAAITGDAVGLQFSIGGSNGMLNFTRKGTSNNSRWTAASFLTTGAWMNLIATSDGVMTDYTHLHIYKAGAEVTYLSGANGAGAEGALVGKWSLMGRVTDDLRNTDGRIAQVGVWNRVITPTEIANLGLFYAPDFAAPSQLQYYFKGNTSSLVASPGGTGTADGTSQLTGVGNGPGIIYG